ncbi:hypothetical protein CEXT_191091 [Caerostris extrusa]|uniref:Uncharacterized protein n=1 Tax=Caerostris extrusa TaxID=172846 RepID=A0AAV4MFH3_CAEEX|nr:hypothetical protein CEXT_191091 [Caerostris extrusa]
MLISLCKALLVTSALQVCSQKVECKFNLPSIEGPIEEKAQPGTFKTQNQNLIYIFQLLTTSRTFTDTFQYSTLTFISGLTFPRSKPILIPQFSSLFGFTRFMWGGKKGEGEQRGSKNRYTRRLSRSSALKVGRRVGSTRSTAPHPPEIISRKSRGSRCGFQTQEILRLAEKGLREYHFERSRDSVERGGY